jgi:hypothetical protein
MIPRNRTSDCPYGRRLALGGQPLQFHGISFIEGGNSITAGNSRILYFHDSASGAIFRRVGSGPPQAITSSGIFIKNFDITVTSARPLAVTTGLPDARQPIVTIFIEAGETAASESFFIQTSITQRTLDL